LGASWNKAILTGGEAPQSEWKIPDFVKIYDGLTDTLVNAGYVKGQNLFTFAYDWRKPINQIADGLKDYLNTVVEPLNPGQKIDLVGHSLGGLVARGYGQKFGLDKIKQVVSLGSPHSGAIQPYSAWAGGEFTSDKLWQYLAFELLIQANKSGFQTDADVFRKQAPVIRDLLPTFNYLKKDSLGNPTVPLANMNPNNRNFWLEGLNGSLSTSFFDVFTAIIGDKGNTPEWYKVREQNWYEKILGLWQDGKPVTTEFAPGDLTVLTKSGKINPDPFKQVTNTDHTGLITTTSGIEKVLEVLGFPSSVPIVTYPEFNFAPGLIFQLLSPARLHITGPSGIFDSDSDNMVLIPNSMPGDYLVDVIGEGDGIYTLLVGQKSSNTTFWNKYMGRVIPGSTESYHFRFDNDNPSPYPLFDQTGMKYLKEARAKILTLPPNPTCGSTVDQINRIIDFIGKSKKAAAFSSCNSLLEKIFDCRKNYSGVSERNILFNAVMDLQEAYVILGNSLRQPDKKGTIAFHSAAKAKMKLANKGLKLLANLNQVSKMQAASFMKAEEVLEMAQAALNQNDYHRVFILSQISIFLTKEAVEK
jgi:pimeloyl-ACP methyl ester carboxylesterase